MKKFILFIFILFILMSCSNEPAFNGLNQPFIVKEIEYHNEAFCLYIGYTQHLITNPEILAPIGIFNLGDTIKVCK